MRSATRLKRYRSERYTTRLSQKKSFRRYTKALGIRDEYANGDPPGCRSFAFLTENDGEAFGQEDKGGFTATAERARAQLPFEQLVRAMCPS